MPTVDGDLPSGPTPEEFSARIFGSTAPRSGAGLELAPFRGVRFAPSIDPEAVTSPPYDLLDREQVERLKAGGGHNIVRITLPTDYGEAAATLRRWLDDGSLVHDPDPALYVYETAGQRGLIGALGLRPESDRVILPHENVYPGPVRDRLALMVETRANLEPIFLVYEGGGDASQILDEAVDGSPLMDFHTGDQRHRLWRIADPALHARIAADLAHRQALIADGHHRYATYRALQARHNNTPLDSPTPPRSGNPWDYGLALLVDSTRYPPHLGAIHRVLPSLPPEKALQLAAKAFETARLAWPEALPALKGADGPAFLLAGGETPYLLTNPAPAYLERTMPAQHSARWRNLGTAVLDHLLIRHLWRVPEDEQSVEVVHDDPLLALNRARHTGGTAVILNPLKVEEVLAIAAQGERVPRKSTSFGPKPRTGLVLRLLSLP
ncbi:DUF1015 domain-containing protein [Actinomadura sp. NBRC 104412]|uniref:DUF1015 domain-containing protein n=1 Tax=Actinomadura sp. NBRC 104412 TaxID=3032203 RepID=UPI00255785A5|nr:DUF1015 domain-containing protein [Actinomadura sp. NBRC 104412]